jgi:hypothetical protein
MRDEVVDKAIEIVSDCFEVGADRVAPVLAEEILNRDTFDVECADGIAAGVGRAIDEIDEATFDAAFDTVQARVAAAIEGQAKQIALRMLRELAAQSKVESVAG